MLLLLLSSDRCFEFTNERHDCSACDANCVLLRSRHTACGRCEPPVPPNSSGKMHIQPVRRDPASPNSPRPRSSRGTNRTISNFPLIKVRNPSFITDPLQRTPGCSNRTCKGLPSPVPKVSPPLKRPCSAPRNYLCSRTPSAARPPPPRIEVPRPNDYLAPRARREPAYIFRCEVADGEAQVGGEGSVVVQNVGAVEG